MRRYGQYPLGWQQFGHLGLTSTFGAFTPGEGVGAPSWVPRDDNGLPFLFVFDIENTRGWFNGVRYDSIASFLTAVGGTNNGDGTYTIGPTSDLPFTGFDLTQGTIVDRYSLSALTTSTMAWTIQTSGVNTNYIRQLCVDANSKASFDVLRSSALQAQRVTPAVVTTGQHRHCCVYKTNEFTMHRDGEEIGLPDLSGQSMASASNIVLMIGHRAGTIKLPGTSQFWAYTPSVVSRLRRRVLSGGSAAGLDGAWTWFTDERAIEMGNGVPIYGAVGQTGDVLVSDLSTTFTLKSAMEVDDHDNPGLLRLANGKILAHYCKHTNANFYQRISANADDISAWGTEVDLDSQFGLQNYAYSHPIQMDDGTLYTFFRANNGTYERTWHYSKSTDNGVTWSAAVRIIDTASGARPYVHMVKNGASRIDFVTSTGHPNEVAACSLYHFYMDTSADSFHATDGTSLGATPFAPDTGTLVWDGTTSEGWSWDIRVGAGSPVIVFAVFVSTTDHRYRYATTDGSTWTTNQICTAGGTIYATPGDQDQYSGGVSIDPDDINTVYCSRENGTTGVFQLWRGVTADGGANWTMTQLTTGQEDQFRPFKVAGTDALGYVTGPYFHYNLYLTRIDTIDVA